MQKIIKVSETTAIGMKASALTPFKYRELFNRDLAADMNTLKESYKNAKSKNEQLGAGDIRIFLNVAYTMARQYAEATDALDFPADPYEWLDRIDNVLTIYEILPQMFELWAENNKTLSTPRKK